jgi:hypothetical protein
MSEKMTTWKTTKELKGYYRFKGDRSVNGKWTELAQDPVSDI